MAGSYTTGAKYPSANRADFPDATINAGASIQAADQGYALYYSNGTTWVLSKGKNPSKVAAIIGDSIVAGGNRILSISAIRPAGNVAICSCVNHGIRPGCRMTLGEGDNGIYGGVRVCDSVIDANTFTFIMPNLVTVGETNPINVTLEQFYNDRNFLVIANQKAGSPIDQVINRAISGQTSTQIVARLERDILSKIPNLERLMVCMGTNDGIALTAPEQIPAALDVCTANYITLIEKCLAYGVKYIDMCTPPPSNIASNSLLVNKFMLDLSHRLKKIAVAYEAVFVWDLYNTWVNPTSSTVPFTASLTFDGTHQNATASYLAANQNYATNAFSMYNKQVIPRSQSILDLSSNDSFNPNISFNPLMQGTGGTIGNNATGTAPNGTTISTNSANVTVVSSVVATTQTGGTGNDWTLVITATGAGVAQAVIDQYQTRFSYGESADIEALITYSAITGAPSVALKTFGSDTNNNFFDCNSATFSNGQGGLLSPGTYLMRSISYTKDLGTGGFLGAVNSLQMMCQVQFLAAGTITIQISNSSIMKNFG